MTPHKNPPARSPSCPTNGGEPPSRARTPPTRRYSTHLLDIPIFNADTAQQITGTTDASTYRALGRLTDAGILEILSESKRNRIWAATDVLTELDALSAAIGKRTTDHL